ncbi:MAG: NADH:flavin oxidoreductase [Nitrospiraceae bacterium]|nr:NADH:flavin oxidoreductase [Nitrospiraceae bacterium]
MRRDSYKLFSQGTIGSLNVKNRFVRSATYETAASSGLVTDQCEHLYRTLARGGSGLIITGHMAVLRAGSVGPHQTHIYEDAHTSSIRRIVHAARTSDPSCRIVAQLNHIGRNVLLDNSLAEPVGPSAVPLPILRRRPRALSTGEIEAIVAAFADAVRRVRDAGFDGVQINAAHGWLLSSFLSPYSNRREDRYGGGLQGRLTILREIMGLARNRVGSEFPILVKLNCDDFVPGGLDADGFPALAEAVQEAGVDAIEVSGGTWDCLTLTKADLGFPPIPLPEARMGIERMERQSYFATYAAHLDLSVPVILVGGNRSIEGMEGLLQKGTADFFALARPLIREPGLPKRWLEGRGPEAPECESCNACLLSLKWGPTRCLARDRRTRFAARKVVRHGWKLFLR